MVAINKIISANVSIDNVSCAAKNGTKEYNISEIDFERLKNEFKKSDLKNIILRDIEKVIENKLKNMIKGNPTRIDYYEHYQKIIKAYNAEQNRATIEKIFDELMELAKEMTQEEARYAREGFKNDEELALYDMLFKESLSKTEIKKLKRASVAILETIKLRMDTFDHCLDKDETNAQLQTIIRDTLFNYLPTSYNESNIDNYQRKVYKYVCKRYLKAA